MKNSPDWVRISYASALALRVKSGRFSPDFPFGGINLLLTYDEGCLSDCGYCGLARSRQGAYDDKSFIRVEWPLIETDELVDRMARYEENLTRLCISMVTHGSAYADTLDITRRIRAKVKTPLSLLVAPPTLNAERLKTLKDAGADMVGIGLDAATEELFKSIRSDVPKGGLDWNQYWGIIDAARDTYGPWQVNCHVMVGLGETDHDLMSRFERHLDREIYSYLFCFHPEPDSRLADHPKSSVSRWRRIQLAKFLFEERGLASTAFSFDDDGALAAIEAPRALIDEVVHDGYAFMTNGCPGEEGEPGCTRPMGSWRPTESPRDYPYLPETDDQARILEELELDQLIRPTSTAPIRAHRAPPAAGRVPLSTATRPS